MAYITITDLYNEYGNTNIAAWSDLTGGQTVDTDRTDGAIEWAEKYVENKFRGSRYTVPFTAASSTIDPVLTSWMAQLAGVWLYRTRTIRRGESDTERTSTIKKDVDDDMRMYLAGQARLDVALTPTPSTNAPSCIF
jgi:phage gp36-like protein